jgi:hypothetical protein
VNDFAMQTISFAPTGNRTHYSSVCQSFSQSLHRLRYLVGTSDVRSWDEATTWILFPPKANVFVFT